jgi:hypothetical protein
VLGNGLTPVHSPASGFFDCRWPSAEAASVAAVATKWGPVGVSSRTYKLSLLAAGIVIFALGNLALEIKSAPEGLGWLSFFRPHLGEWLTPQYLVSYDVLGFTKRALVGTVVGLLSEQRDPLALALIAAVPTVALVVVFALRLADRTHPVLAVVALVSPAAFMQIGFDLGRFDHLVYLLFILILALEAAFLILLAPLTLFVHEAVLIIHLPLLAAVHLARHGADRFFAIFVVATAVIFLVLFMQPTRVSIDELLALYPSAAEPALAVYTRSFWSNIPILVEYVLTRTDGDVVGMAIATVYLACTIALVRPLVGQSRAGRLTLLACLSPLLLSLIGIDWPRWIALSSFNLFLLATTELARSERPVGRFRTLVVVPYMMGISVLGPLGTDQPFPFWR